MIEHRMMKELGQAVENEMLRQLGDLVKDGLLVWESTEPVIMRDYMDPYKFTVSQLGRFRLRDQELLDRLRAENESLNKRLRTIELALSEGVQANESD